MTARELMFQHPILLNNKYPLRVFRTSDGRWAIGWKRELLVDDSREKLVAMKKNIQRMRRRNAKTLSQSVSNDKYLVFVYGTLKREQFNHHRLNGSKFIGTARTMDNFAMYGSGIPFVRMSEHAYPIYGEVYEVNRRTLIDLDWLEGHPTSYERRLVPVYVQQLGSARAWLYFHDRAGGTRLKKGVWNGYSY